MEEQREETMFYCEYERKDNFHDPPERSDIVFRNNGTHMLCGKCENEQLLSKNPNVAEVGGSMHPSISSRTSTNCLLAKENN
jgi:hypothetical protein